jgi:hypothetical protein
MRIYLSIALFLELTLFAAPVGLSNLGNTCYMNALLQAFLNIPELATLTEKNLGASPTAKLFFAIAAHTRSSALNTALRSFYAHLDTQFELISLERILSELGNARTVEKRRSILKRHATLETLRAADIAQELQDTDLSYDRKTDLINRKKRALQTVRILSTLEELLNTPDIPVEAYYSLITMAREKEEDLGYRQQDAEEFYSIFMNSLSIPAVEKLFAITQQRLINNVPIESTTTTNRLLLQLYKNPGEYVRTVQEALNYSCAEETLDENYAIPFAKTRLLFTALPKLLVIQTPRYEQDIYGRRIRISPVVIASNPLIFTRLEQGINARYTPEALVVQSGTLSGGHYTAYIKAYADGLWYFCNDSTITKLGAELISDKYYPYEPNTYLLFYRRIDDPEVRAIEELAESLWRLKNVFAE